MKLSRRNPANRNITRMEHEKVRGYWVRVVKDGKLHQKLFSDGQYGGKRKAFEAAKVYRDELRRTLFGEYADASRRICSTFKGNTSGVVGVHKVEKRRGNAVSRAYVASWCPVKGGPQRHKYFNINALGEDEALRQATEFRREREREIMESSRRR